MSLSKAISDELHDGSVQKWLELIPYAKFLGITANQHGDDLLFILPPNPNNIGNPMLPAIHGGVVGAFMENAAALHLITKMSDPKMPKLIDFSLDYLRPARDQETFAECEITRQGRRIANVSIKAWQNSRVEAVAEARAHFLLSDSDSVTDPA
jgi:uncharacterized protein (TIGR00369 family)